MQEENYDHYLARLIDVIQSCKKKSTVNQDLKRILITYLNRAGYSGFIVYSNWRFSKIKEEVLFVIKNDLENIDKEDVCCCYNTGYADVMTGDTWEFIPCGECHFIDPIEFKDASKILQAIVKTVN